MKKTEIFLHIGLHKTGTTFFQNNIYNNIDDINLIKNNVHLRDIVIEKNKKNIIINEGFSRSLPYIKSGNRTQILKYLKAIFPDAKIIIGIRYRDSWLKSTYSQYIKHGGTLKYSEYLSLYKNNCIDQQEYLNLIKNKWDEVYIIKFEEFISNQDKTINDLCDFIACKVPVYSKEKPNVSLTKMQLTGLRILNKITISGLNNNKIGIPHVIIRKFIRLIRPNE